MSITVGPPEFEEILRRHLRLADQPDIDADRRLVDLGLDSLSTTSLVVDLEDAFDVDFPDEKLSLDTFATARTLWSVVDELRAVGATENSGT